MAKVKITGHASGTGILTVTAPNTSTDRTITLPDETATLSTFDPDGAVVINETGADVDFRVESDDNANMLFVDGSEDKIGIGINNPGVQLANLAGTGTNIGAAGINWNSSEASKYVAQFRNGSDPAWGISIKLGLAAPEATDKYIDFIDDDGVIQSSLTGTGEAGGGLAIQTAGTERIKITEAGLGVSQFTARCWCRIDGVGSAAFTDSHNCSSLTDNGTGDYTVNFTTNLGNTEYALFVNGRDDNHNTTVIYAHPAGNRTTSGFQVFSQYIDAASGAVDSDDLTCVCFGD